MLPKTALTLIALAATVLAAPFDGGSLTVSVEAPGNLTSIDDLKVRASVTNGGKEDVTIVNYGTILDYKRPTQSFRVTKGGVQANFTGIRLQLNMNGLDDSAYTTIKAGETITVEHELATLYDFEGLGEGALDIEPLAQLPIVVSRVPGRRPELTPFRFTATPIAKVLLTGDIARRSLASQDTIKRATVSCSASSYAEFLAESYRESKILAAIAGDFVSNYSNTRLYAAYWKNNNPQTVWSVFAAIVTEDTAARPLGCSDPYNQCSEGTIAYTVTSIAERPIYFCKHTPFSHFQYNSWDSYCAGPVFFTEVETSTLCTVTTVGDRNIRGGTVLHESTHAIAGTTDVGYGCDYDQSLPAQYQLGNADNYNCFATHVYALTQC